MGQIFPCLQSFRDKCGFERDLFDSSRFDVKEGMSKGVALSRVALWTAIKDVYEVHTGLTPGQIATIVDAAPIIVGARVRRDLERTSNLGDLHDVIAKEALHWDCGIVAGSQLWSLQHYVAGKMSPGYLLNSKYDDRHLAQFGLMSALLGQRSFCEANAASLLHILDTTHGLPARIALDKASLSEKSEFAHVLSLADTGSFGELLASDRNERVINRIEALISATSGQFSSQCTEGAFLGSRSMQALREKSREVKVGDAFRATPMGHYLHLFVDGCAYTPSQRSDMLSAAMRGAVDAWERFCPIVIPELSITKVRQMERGVTLELPLGDTPPESTGAVLYTGSRFPKYLTIWMNKHIQEVLEQSHDIQLPPGLLKMIGQTRRRASAISQREEIPFDEAVEESLCELMGSSRNVIQAGDLEVIRTVLLKSTIADSLDHAAGNDHSKGTRSGHDYLAWQGPEPISDGEGLTREERDVAPMQDRLVEDFNSIHDCISEFSQKSSASFERGARGVASWGRSDLRIFEVALHSMCEPGAASRYMELIQKAHAELSAREGHYQMKFDATHIDPTVSVGEAIVGRLCVKLAALPDPDHYMGRAIIPHTIRGKACPGLDICPNTRSEHEPSERGCRQTYTHSDSPTPAL